MAFITVDDGSERGPQSVWISKSRCDTEPGFPRFGDDDDEEGEDWEDPWAEEDGEEDDDDLEEWPNE